MVDDQIRMSMPEINNEYYLPPVTDLEDDEYEEGPVDYETPEYLSYDEYVSDTKNGIPSRYNKWLGGKNWLCGRGIRLY